MSGNLHSFDQEIAQSVGMVAAVIYQNLKFWCAHNHANDRHQHEGETWTYNSVKAFQELFPYLTEKQIRTALELLEERGMIRSGNFNETAYDRTKWFCLPGQFHLPHRANGFAPQGEPIPDSKPDHKPDDPHTPAEEQLTLLSEDPTEAPRPNLEDQFQRFWKAYPKKEGKDAARRAFAKAVKRADADTLIEAARRYAASDQVARGFVKHAQGWLNDGRWQDEGISAPQPDLRPGFWEERVR